MPAPPVGRCVHCLEDDVVRTWDHAPPRSWYPVPEGPENFERWVVPSCLPCNAELGRVEERLLRIFALCCDPNSAAASGIAEPVHRSMDPRCARDERDREARQRRAEQLQRELQLAGAEAVPHTLPGFVPQDGNAQPALALTVPVTDLEAFAIKMVRALTYVDGGGQFIEPDHEISIFFDTLQGAVIAPLIDQWGRQLRRGPGVLVERATPANDPMSSANFFQLWSTFSFWVIVKPVDDE